MQLFHLFGTGVNFNWEINLGNVISIVTVLVTLLWRIERWMFRMERLFDRMGVEHEMLIQDYCGRHNIKPHELPTRVRTLVEEFKRTHD